MKSRFSSITLACCLLVLSGSSWVSQDSVGNEFDRPDRATARRGPKVGGQPLRQPAERLLPSTRGSRPLVQPSNANPTQHRNHKLVQLSRLPSEASVVTPSAESQLKFRLEMRELEARLRIAQVRTQAFQRQLARFEAYNQFASPHTLSMLPANSLPHSNSLTPQTIVVVVEVGPVASFAPRSTFSHVLSKSRQRLRDSQLEVQALLATRQSLQESQDSAETHMGQPAASFAIQAQRIQAELVLQQFRAESARLREQQFDNWAVVGGVQSRSSHPLLSTTASPFSRTNLTTFPRLSQLANAGLADDLKSRIQLQRLEHEIRVANLVDQREAIREYIDTSSQSQRSLNVASERPKVQAPPDWATTSN